MKYGTTTTYAIKVTKPDGSVIITMKEGNAVAYLLADDSTKVERLDLNSDNIEGVLNSEHGLFIDLISDDERDILIDFINAERPSESEAYSRATRGH